MFIFEVNFHFHSLFSKMFLLMGGCPTWNQSRLTPNNKWGKRIFHDTFPVGSVPLSCPLLNDLPVEFHSQDHTCLSTGLGQLDLASELGI